MLRIIAGEHRHRHIKTPDDLSVRPLPDRVRQAIFNMLHGHEKGHAYFDVFAGSGSFGLEALSRGASRVVFVERDRRIGRMLRENIEHLGVQDRAEIVSGDALGVSTLARCPRPVHVVFFDPPYPMMEEPNARRRILEQFAKAAQHLDDDGFAIIRTPWPFRKSAQELPGAGRGERPAVDLTIPGLIGPETRAYGSTAVHWYAKAGGADSLRSAAERGGDQGADSPPEGEPETSDEG